jgi:regulator of sirC expression with transglutaminase-like and TPR domain
VEQIKEIQALITLLDDPDEQVFLQVQQRLMKIGKAVIPNLEAHWEHNINELVQFRIEELIHAMNFEALKQQLVLWCGTSDKDLFEALIIASEYRYANPNIAATRRTMKSMYQSIWLEMNNYLSPMEQVNVLSSVLYNMYKITSDEAEPLQINHFFINNVLEQKIGNRYSIGIYYVHICKLLQIPIYVVQLPNQFLLAYYDYVFNYLSPTELPEEKILFYIEPTNGMVYTQNDVDAYLKKVNFNAADKQYMKPLSNKEILKVYFQQLLKCYESDDLINQKEKEILQLIDVLDT